MSKALPRLDRCRDNSALQFAAVRSKFFMTGLQGVFAVFSQPSSADF